MNIMKEIVGKLSSWIKFSSAQFSESLSFTLYIILVFTEHDLSAFRRLPSKRFYYFTFCFRLINMNGMMAAINDNSSRPMLSIAPHALCFAPATLIPYQHALSCQCSKHKSSSRSVLPIVRANSPFNLAESSAHTIAFLSLPFIRIS